MEYVTVIFSLVGVIGLIFATYYGTKWLSKRVNFTGNILLATALSRFMKELILVLIRQ